jgi:hypothetical protein
MWRAADYLTPMSGESARTPVSLNRLRNPSGTAGTVLTVVQTGALAIWAVDELARGVNPFRRMLGAAFLVWIVASLTF